MYDTWFIHTPLKHSLGNLVFDCQLKVLYNPQAFFTHAVLLDQASAIVQYSPLLPPVGVWTVSQFQCG